MSKSELTFVSALIAILLLATGCEFRRAGRIVVREVKEDVRQAREDVRDLGDRVAGEATPSPADSSPVIVPLRPSPTPIFDSDGPAVATTIAHPRLYFDAGEIPALREKISAIAPGLETSLRDFVTSQIGSVPSANLLARQQLDTYRNAGNGMISLAFACAASQQEASCDLARTYLLNYAGWEQWGENGERSLGHAHMVMGNAIAYDWLYSVLDDKERSVVRDSLVRRAQELYEASSSEDVNPEWNNWWRNAYVQNHYFTAHSALGVAGLALIGEEARAPMWVEYAAERMTRIQFLLNGIGDGTWHEGIGYQGYALTMALPFWVNLRKIVGVDLFPHDYLKAYPYWRIYNYLPDSTQFIMGYGDIDWAFLGSRTQSVLRFIANEYDDGHAQWMAEQMTAAESRRTGPRASAWHVFEFLHFSPAVAAQPPVDLPLARAFSDLESVIWRTGWEQDDLVFALKAGPYGGRFAFDTFVEEVYPWEAPCPITRCQLSMGHDHADAGTFYLYGRGTWLTSEHVSYGAHETSYHNTLLIDGAGQQWPRREERRNPDVFADTDGNLEATASTLHFSYAAADLTGPYRYAEGIEDVTRHALFIRPDTFILVDSIASTVPHRYQWIAHFPVAVQVEDRWILGRAEEGEALALGVAAPASAEMETGNDGLPYVRITPGEPASDLRFVTVLYPISAAAWGSQPQFELLQDSGEALVLRLTRAGGAGSYEDILINYGRAGERISVGAYETDARIAVVGWSAGNVVESLFIFGGTSIAVGGELLESGLVPEQPFEVQYGTGGD